MDLITYFDKYVDKTMMMVIALFLIAFLFALYAIALINRRMRLMLEELKQISEDNKLLNESIRIVQNQLMK